jgi:ribosomal protein L22
MPWSSVGTIEHTSQGVYPRFEAKRISPQRTRRAQRKIKGKKAKNKRHVLSVVKKIARIRNAPIAGEIAYL